MAFGGTYGGTTYSVTPNFSTPYTVGSVTLYGKTLPTYSAGTAAAALPPSGGATPAISYNEAKSEYGAVIPISMGTRRMPGQLIWARAVYGDATTGYFCDFAISWGYNGDTNPEDTAYTRLFANGAKIWEGGTPLLGGGWAVTLYTGTETQTADPTIAASVGTSSTPGYRNQLYGVFTGFPLAAFNNSVPAISAEISGTLGTSLVVTHTHVGNAWRGIRSTTAKSTGRYYLEVQWTTFFANAALGFANASATLSDYPGVDNNGVSYTAPRDFWRGGTIVQSEAGTDHADGAWIGVDVDMTSGARQFRVRDVTLGDSWSSWVSLGSSTQTGDVYFIAALWSLNDSHRVNFGGTSFQGEIPTGADPWDDVYGGTLLNASDKHADLTLDSDAALGSITLQSFIERVAEYAKLDASADLDFDAAIDDTITGGLITADTNFGEFSKNLGRAFGFDLFEGDTIEFTKAVNGATYTIDSTILPPAFLNQGERAIGTTRGEDDSPILIELSYIDQSQQFRYNVQRARRVLYPVRTTESRRRDAFAIPVVITANEAITLAGQTIYREAGQNVLHSFRLPAEYLYIEPGDILAITAGSASYTVKVVYMALEADCSVSVRAVNLLTDEDFTLTGDSGAPLDSYIGVTEGITRITTNGDTRLTTAGDTRIRII